MGTKDAIQRDYRKDHHIYISKLHSIPFEHTISKCSKTLNVFLFMTNWNEYMPRIRYCLRNLSLLCFDIISKFQRIFSNSCVRMVRVELFGWYFFLLISREECFIFILTRSYMFCNDNENVSGML